MNSTVAMSPIQYIILSLMLVASFISIVAVARSSSLSERIAIASSLGNKLAFVIIAFALFRNDWMIGSVGAVILISGDAGMIILALTELQE